MLERMTRRSGSKEDIRRQKKNVRRSERIGVGKGRKRNRRQYRRTVREHNKHKKM
jgi:hypothetical protein